MKFGTEPSLYRLESAAKKMPTEKASSLLASTIEQGDELESLEYSAPAEPAPVNPQGLTSIEIAWLLWGKRAFLKRLLFVGLLVSTAIAFLIPKRYVATAQLMPPDFNSASALVAALPALSSPGDAAGAAGGGVMSLANRLLGLNSPGQLMIGVLRSRTIEDSLIERFVLMELYSARYPEDARKKLEGYTDVGEDSKTGIISIAVEDKSPERAAAMVQAYTEELNRVLAQVNTSAAHRERLFIEQRLSEVKTELDSSARDFSQFASQNAAIDIPEQAKAMVGAAADLQAQLIASQSMLRGLQQLYTDNNPRVRQVQAQIAELEKQLAKMGGKNLNMADGSSLSKDEVYPSIRQLPLLGVRYLDLYRRSKINEAVYELLSKEYEVIKIQEARNMPTVQVLDQAVIPQKKAGPRRLWIMLGGTSFCFLCGAIWIVGVATWERTDPRQPWKELAQEVFASTKASTWDGPRGRRIRARLPRTRWHRNSAPPQDPDHT
jgi:capsule polysaccharide export protein KpsE/RkpR